MLKSAVSTIVSVLQTISETGTHIGFVSFATTVAVHQELVGDQALLLSKISELERTNPDVSIYTNTDG